MIKTRKRHIRLTKCVAEEINGWVAPLFPYSLIENFNWSNIYWTIERAYRSVDEGIQKKLMEIIKG